MGEEFADKRVELLWIRKWVWGLWSLIYYKNNSHISLKMIFLVPHTQWPNLWNLHAINPVSNGKARVRVPRLLPEMSQTMSRSNSTPLPEANNSVNRTVSMINTLLKCNSIDITADDDCYHVLWFIYFFPFAENLYYFSFFFYSFNLSCLYFKELSACLKRFLNNVQCKLSRVTQHHES